MEPNIPTNSEPQIPIQPIVLPVQPTTEPIQVPVEQNFEPTKKSLPKWPLIIVGVILLATLLTGTYLLGKNQNTKTACITEAKLCPDGSAVGRTGPKCEFSACPKTPTPTLTPISTTSRTLIATNTAGWKTYTNSGATFSFKYPNEWTISSFSNDSIKLSKTTKGEGPTGNEISHISTLAITSSPVANITLDEFLKEKYIKSEYSGEINLIEQFSKDSNIDGIKAKYVVVPGAAGFDGDGLVAINNGIGYNISLHGFIDDDAALKGIISTFKFTP